MIDDVEFRKCMEHYDFPESAFTNYQFFRRGKKNIFVAKKEVRLSELAFHQGIPFLKINIKIPKLTSVAALKFGTYARKNTLKLNSQQLASYVGRKIFKLEPGQIKNCDFHTYALFFYEHSCIGMGIFDEELNCAGLMPKAWSHYYGEGKMNLDGYLY